MRISTTRNKVKNWLRAGAKLSLLLTDPRIRSEVGGKLNDQVGEMMDTAADKYEDAVDRIDAAADALRGRSRWPARFGTFLLGVGVGAGLGILLAPASGTETRDTIRDRAVAMKSKIFESAAVPFTGTKG